MPRFAANLTMMYGEYVFAERFAAARRDGFGAVECLFPYEWPVEEVERRLRASGLSLELMNAPPGDWAAGERGLACLPGREEAFRESVREGLRYAGGLGCARMHVMSGIRPTGASLAEVRGVYEANLRWAVGEAEQMGVTLLLEPLNPRDMPGYLLSRQEEARAVVEAIGSRWLKVQMDLYHCQIVEGDLTRRLQEALRDPRETVIGHIQIAGVPERQEPDAGEVDYGHLLRLLDELGYAGWVGCEYRPRAGTSEGLGWMRPWRSA